MADDNTGPWSLGELAKLRAMFEDRADDKTIAVELGRSARAVAVKRHTLGLVFYKRATRPPGDATGWVSRCKHFEAALDLALALADTRAPHTEIAAEIRDAFKRAPKP